MNLSEQHLHSQCIWLFTPDTERTADNVKTLDIIRSAEKRYGFLQVPQTISEFNPKDGITFLEGQFNKTYRISKFQFYENGLLAEGDASTEILDEFLTDIMQLIGGHSANPYVEESPSSYAYLSQLEITIDLPLLNYFDEFLKIGQAIGDFNKSYGQNSTDFTVSQIELFCDAMTLKLPRPGASFQFGRRNGQAHDANLYYSSAPLKTADHLTVLTSVIKMLSSIKKSTVS